MYKIDKSKDKPDIGYMEMTMDKLMRRGVRLGDCNEIREHYDNMREVLKSEIRIKYHIDNPNSSQQITRFIQSLSDKVDITAKNDIVNICYDDKTFKWTSNAEALTRLSDLGYEFAKDLLDYRHAKKYAEIIDSFNNAADKDGLIHPIVSLGKTNRINYTKPGLMNVPKNLTNNLIVPYTPGNALFSVDIKNQEPTILFNMLGAEELKYALESEEGLYETMFKKCFKPFITANVLMDTLPENRMYSISELKQIGTISPALYSPVKPMIKDVYYNDVRVIGLETICIGSEKGVYPDLPKTVDIELENGTIQSVEVEWESADKKYKKSADYSLVGNLKGLDIKVGKAERREFKTAWLAISYGASIFGVQQSCKTIDGKHVYNYITKIDELKDYRNKIDKLARRGINVIGTIFGNKIYAGEFDDWKKLKRALLNLPIQGSGADILSLLIKHFYEYTEANNLTDKIELYYTRHDELIIEVNKDWLHEVGENHVKEILKDMLEHQVDDWTPFKIEIDRIDKGVLSLDFEEESDYE